MSNLPVEELLNNLPGNRLELLNLAGHCGPEIKSVRMYGCADFTKGQRVTIDPTKEPGWVSYQWEEADELWLDGKLLWRVVNGHANHPLKAAVAVNGKVLNYYLDWDGDVIQATQPWPLISLVAKHEWVREV